LPNKSIAPVSLSDYKGKWVVLFFYPLDFTFVCPTEIVAFSEAAAEFAKLNTQVLGVSVDSVFTHLAWVNTDRKNGGLGEMHIPLIQDVNKKISIDYGVLHMDSGHTLRGLFIIDPKGIVRQITMNDLPVGRNTQEILRLVEAFQFTDEHGEVCPANWSKGKPTMKADPTQSLEFFSKNA
jgi:alkyl hydroperoxide reductase subunit AhpC